MTIAEFANAVYPYETAHNETSNLDPQCLSSSLLFPNKIYFILKVFAGIILPYAISALYGLKTQRKNKNDVYKTLCPQQVYKTLCPQQMLVHKGGQINNVQLITGVSEDCRYVTTRKLQCHVKGQGGCVQRM